jgi:uncharacterized protein YbbC (DUF1343 family)
MLNFQLISCAQSSGVKVKKMNVKKEKSEILKIKTAAERTNLYIKLLKGKNVAVVANQTSVISSRRADDGVRFSKIKYVHLVDSLLSLNIDLKKVFAPEHGFR